MTWFAAIASGPEISGPSAENHHLRSAHRCPISRQHHFEEPDFPSRAHSFRTCPSQSRAGRHEPLDLCPNPAAKIDER
jgi:hypothetical protein